MKELWQELILFLQVAIAPVIGEAKKATGNIFFDIYVLDFLDVPDTVSEYDLQKGRGVISSDQGLTFSVSVGLPLGEGAEARGG